MCEQDKRLNESPIRAEIEWQLSSLEPVSPRLDRDALMYRAGWAAALAQRPAARGVWLVPAVGGFLAATAAGLLAVVVWRSTVAESAGARVAQNAEAQGPEAPGPEARGVVTSPPGPRPANEPLPDDDPAPIYYVGDTGSSASRRGEPVEPPSRQDERSLPAGVPPSANGVGDPWGIVSMALAERHGVHWDEPWQRETGGESATAAPPPTLMQMMRDAGAWPEHRGTAPQSHPLWRLMGPS